MFRKTIAEFLSHNHELIIVIVGIEILKNMCDLVEFITYPGHIIIL